MNFTPFTDKLEKRTLTFSVFMTIIFGMGCIFFSYPFVPFAAAFYAVVLLCEFQRKKVFSVILPLVMCFLNFAFNGPYSTEGIVCVFLGLIIYICFTCGKTKAECAFWCTLVYVLSIVASLVFIPIAWGEGFSLEFVKDFYTALYVELKMWFVDFITGFAVPNNDGIYYFLFNASDAEALFNSLILSTIPLVIVIAFLLAGVSIKCFSHYLKKISDPESHVFSWEFSTSSFLAYFYIAISIVNVFISNSADTFVIVVSTLNTIMLCIYAYLGIKFARHYLSKKIGLVPATIILVFAVLLFSSFSLTLLSYFGVYFTILMNRMLNTNNNFDK